MKTYEQRYEGFTCEIVNLAEQIQQANNDKFINIKYGLPKTTLALRNIYKNPVYHNMFVGGKISDNKWSYGFCAVASVIIYEMYGGPSVWNFMAIRYNDWISSIVFLQDKSTGINFGTVGEYYYPLEIPYNIGKPLEIKKLKTPNKDIFKKILLQELERM